MNKTHQKRMKDSLNHRKTQNLQTCSLTSQLR